MYKYKKFFWRISHINYTILFTRSRYIFIFHVRQFTGPCCCSYNFLSVFYIPNFYLFFFLWRHAILLYVYGHTYTMFYRIFKWQYEQRSHIKTCKLTYRTSYKIALAACVRVYVALNRFFCAIAICQCLWASIYLLL